MDVVEFKIMRYAERLNQSVLDIFVNGQRLVEIVGRHEASLADAEGHPSLAGKYIGLARSDVENPIDHFLGKPSWAIFDYRGKTQILHCECGEQGCWPLVCRISANREKVSWSNFEQPHRNGHGKSPLWSYDRFGPFVFDRNQYDDAIKAIASLAG